MFIPFEIVAYDFKCTKLFSIWKKGQTKQEFFSSFNRWHIKWQYVIVGIIIYWC